MQNYNAISENSNKFGFVHVPRAPRNENNNNRSTNVLVCANRQVRVCTLVTCKTAVKLKEKFLEGGYTVQWCCQLMSSFAKSRA